MKDIPISAAEKVAKDHGYDQIIIIGRVVGDDGWESVTTYGKDKANCAAAAQIGDHLKYKVMHWPQIEEQTKKDFVQWLGEDGVQLFSKWWIEYGEIPLVIPSTTGIGHPVHFREGMQVRNWMRQNTDLEEDYVENKWPEFVIECLGLKS